MFDWLSDFFSRTTHKERKFISGEQPLVVFISSVMDSELEWARNLTVNHFHSLIGFIPWAFEYTPASSEEIQEGYLRKVREADFVIWLVGAQTTNPVRLEIQEALAANIRLLAFLLPTRNRDETTNNLIDEAGTRVKWCKVNRQEDLLEALEQSISDEIIRAIRGTPGLGRIARIKEISNASRARCLARWQSAGVSLAQATELFDDQSVGAPPVSVIEKLTINSIVVLTGNFGSGKSLISERIFQLTISNFGSPVFNGKPGQKQPKHANERS